MAKRSRVKKKTKRPYSTSQIQRRRQHKSSNKVGAVISAFFRTLMIVLVLITLGYGVLKLLVIPRFFSITQVENILVISHDDSYSDADIIYFHLDPNVALQKIVAIESEELVTVSAEYGEYPLKSVYDLVSLEPQEQKYMKAYFAQIFGVVFDEVVSFNQGDFDQVEHDSQVSIFLQALQQYWSNTNVFHEAKIRYHLAERLQIQPQSEAQSEMVAVNTVADAHVSSFPTGVSQQCPIAVFNGTDSAGLARRVTDLLEASGFFVVRTSVQEKETKVGVVIDRQVPEECNKIVSTLAQLLFPEAEVRTEDTVMETYRASIVLFLGEEHARIFSQ